MDLVKFRTRYCISLSTKTPLPTHPQNEKKPRNIIQFFLKNQENQCVATNFDAWEERRF